MKTEMCHAANFVISGGTVSTNVDKVGIMTILDFLRLCAIWWQRFRFEITQFTMMWKHSRYTLTLSWFFLKSWRQICTRSSATSMLILWWRKTAMPNQSFYTAYIPRYTRSKWVNGFNTLRPGQNGRHFTDDIFKCIFLNKNVWIPIEISLKFVPKGPINNIPSLVQIMAWRRPGDKPLSEPMMVSLMTHICVTRPQWVNTPCDPCPLHSVTVGSMTLVWLPMAWCLSGWQTLSKPLGLRDGRCIVRQAISNNHADSIMIIFTRITL